MSHAANDTIGIDKVRLNETTIAQYIIIRLQGMEYVYIKEANFYASQTYQKQHIYPSIKQYRNDQERKSVLRLGPNSYRALQYFQKLPVGKRLKHSFKRK